MGSLSIKMGVSAHWSMVTLDSRQAFIDDWGQLAVIILQGLTEHAQKCH